MPKGWTRGPQGQKRPISTNERAVHVMKIATGEIEERVEKPPLPREVLPTGVRNGAPDESSDPPPLYGPGLPPPGAKRGHGA